MLVNRVPSGGTTPNSVTLDHGVAYVLNSGGTGNITGFKLGRHGLVPMTGASSRSRPRRPAPCRSPSRPEATSSSSPRRAGTRSTPIPSTAGVAPEPVPPTPPPAPRRSASRSPNTTRCSHRGGRQCAQLLPARSVHDDHGLAPERPGRRLLGGLDQRRASGLHGQRRNRRHLRLRWPGTGGSRCHAGRRHGTAGRRHTPAGRGDLA